MKITERYTEEKDNLSITQANYIGDFAIRLTFLHSITDSTNW
jgi:hypothetical protein